MTLFLNIVKLGVFKSELNLVSTANQLNDAEEQCFINPIHRKLESNNKRPAITNPAISTFSKNGVLVGYNTALNFELN